MQSEEKTILQRVVENFALSGNASDEQVTVVSLPNGKSSVVENERSIMLKEYVINEKTIWAGYSIRSNTVYLSLTSH